MTQVCKKVLVTGYDLQQQGHRGIAVFSKNVILALHELGYEVWLLTSVMPKEKPLIAEQIQETLDEQGGTPGLSAFVTKLRSSWAFQIFFPRRIKQWLRRLLYRVSYQDFGQGHHAEVQAFNLAQSDWSERLSYLKNVAGFINSPGLFEGSLLSLSQHSHENKQPTEVNLGGFGFDAVFSTCPLPIRFVNAGLQIQTVHDLIPIQIPAEHPWDDPKVFAQRLRFACQADMVLSVSHATSRALLERGFTPKRLEVIYQPKSYTAQTHDSRSTASPFEFPYVLSVGSIEPRKNFALVAHAFLESDLPAKNYRYVIVGEPRANPESYALVKLCRESDRVITTGYISDHQRDELLRYAQAFVFPSILEGYGIPLVDAIQMDKKIICSDIEVFREIAQNNSQFVEARNQGEWRDVFNRLDSIEPARPQEMFEFAGFVASLKRLL